MNIKAFFVDALGSALDLGIGTPDDVLRHITPDVLAAHLPRPLWARLFTACLGAARVDAQLVVETIGVPNFCEHVPTHIIWGCIADIAARSVSKAPVEVQDKPTGPLRSVLSPPPDARPVAAASAPASGPVAVGPSIPAPAQPLADLVSEIEADDRAAASRTTTPRSPTAQRFRQSPTSVSRLTARRPQAAASGPTSAPPPPRNRREVTEDAELDVQTATGVDPAEWRSRETEIPVDDSQLVEWKADNGAPSAITGDEDFSDLGGRKR